MNHFPVFEPSSERIAALEKAAQEADKPLEEHYDASRDVRAKGAAFYAFSADEEARRREMEELRKAREETEAKRREMGAVDVKPGEVEGMAPERGEGKARDGKGKDVERSRALEKRKRELEERRKLVEAKRRKTKGGGGDVTGQKDGAGESSEKVEVKNPMAVAEVETMAKTESTKSKSRWDKKGGSGKGAGKSASTTNAADDFLAQLEQDLVRKRDK